MQNSPDNNHSDNAEPLSNVEPNSGRTNRDLIGRFRHDVRFRHGVFLVLLLIFGTGLRMYQILSPPIDFLSWRDTQTLMVARNFYRDGMNLFKPEVDWRTTDEVAEKGIVGGTELMVVPFLTAALYHVFGTTYWVGRLVPIAFAVAGIFFFHRLVERFHGPFCATVAALLLTVSPYYLYCGRCQMPEPFAFAMTFAVLLYYDRWLQTDRNRDYCLAALFSLLMLLGKPQMGVTVIPMAYLTFQTFGPAAFRKPRLYAFAAIVGVPFLAYMYWTSYVLIPETGISFANTGVFDWARYLGDPMYYVKILKSVWLWSVTPLVCVLACVGLILPRQLQAKTPAAPSRRNGGAYFAHTWLAGAVSLFVLMPGATAPNGYYQLVLAPPAALLAGRALAFGLERNKLWPVAGAATLAAAAYSVYVALRLFQPYYITDYRCGTWVRDNTPSDALVLTSSPSTTALYFADRVGWTSWQERYNKAATFNMDLVEKVRRLGASVVAVPQDTFDNAYYPQFNGIRDSLYDCYNCFKGAGFTVFFLDEPADLEIQSGQCVLFGNPESRKYLRGTWGPDQTAADGTTFTTMGPGNKAHIRFEAQPAPAYIELNVASWAPGQEITMRVNGKWVGTGVLQQAGPRANIELHDLPGPVAGNTYIVTLEVTRRNDDGVSIALYWMKVN